MAFFLTQLFITLKQENVLVYSAIMESKFIGINAVINITEDIESINSYLEKNVEQLIYKQDNGDKNLGLTITQIEDKERTEAIR